MLEFDLVLSLSRQRHPGALPGATRAASPSGRNEGEAKLMKKSLITLAATAALFTLPVQASPLQAGSAGSATAATATTADTDTRVDQALAALAAKVVARGGTRADYDSLVAAFKAQMDAATDNKRATIIRTRFEGVVNDIAERAKTAAIAQEEFDIVKIDAIDARLDNAIASLYARAVAGGATRQEYARVAKYLTAAADAAKSIDPDYTTTRTHLQAMVDGIQKTSSKSAADFQALNDDTTSARLGRNLTILQHRSDAKTLNANDWTRMKNAINDATDSLAKTDAASAATIQKSLLAALDSLQKRAATAGLTRADFDALRDTWTKRARSASAPK